MFKPGLQESPVQTDRGHLTATTSPGCLLKDLRNILEPRGVCGLQTANSYSRKDVSLSIDLVKKIRNLHDLGYLKSGQPLWQCRGVKQAEAKVVGCL